MHPPARCFVLLAALAACAIRAEAQYVEATVSSFGTSSTSYVNVTGGSLSFTPAVSSDIWILLFSAKLTSASTTTVGSVEARYLVNAVEHGMGGTYNAPTASEGGPWQHFYRVTGTTATQQVQVQLRDITGAGATIEDLRIVAFKLPPGADFHYTETDADTAAPNAWTVHETLNITPSSPGTYLVFGLVNGTEAPDTGTVAVRFRDPSSAEWPVEHEPGVQRWDYYINPSQVWQSFFVARAESLSGPASYDLEVSGGTSPSGTIRYRRLMAFRTDAFENFESAQDVSVSSTTSATPVVKSTLQTQTPPIARDYIVIQNIATAGVVGGSATNRQAAFETDDVVQVAHDRTDGSQFFTTSYSRVDALTADRSMKFENTFSTSNGDEVRAKESVIHVLRLPSTTYDGYRLIGFETGDASEIAALGPSAVVQGATVRPGSGSFALQEGSTSTLASGMTPPIDTFAMRFSFLKQTNPGALQTMVQLKNGATNLWSLGLTTTGRLRVQQNEAIGLTATTGAIVLENNRWYTVRIVYDRAAGGRLRVLIFESLDIDTTHSSGGSAVDAIDVSGSAGPNEFFYDDFFVASSSVRLPMGQIVRRGPDSGGAASGFDTRVGSATPFQNVDEVTPGGGGDTDYNQHAASTVATDLYGLQDSAPGPINAVKAMWRMQLSAGGGAGTHDYAWREGGTTASTEFVGFGAAFQTTEEIWSTAPVSGGSWTETKFDALELGAVHNGTMTEDTFISWTTAMVDYRPVAHYRSIGTSGSYSTNTVSVANGAYLVHGSGTLWEAANRGRGDRIRIAGVDYTVASVDAEDRLTLTTPYEGATGAGKTYSIHRQYTLLQDWADCVTGVPAACTFFPVAGTDLVAENRSEVGIAYDDSPFTADVQIDGATTDANHRITLTADDGNRHYGIPGQGVLIDASALTTDPIRVRDDFVTVQWLEVSGGGDPSVDAVHVTNQAVPNHVIVRNMLLHGQPRYGITTVNNDIVISIYNNIVYDDDRGIRIDGSLNPNARVRILNNTVYNSASTGAISSQGGSSVIVLRNNIAHTTNGGAGNDYDVPNLDANSSHNLASDTTGIAHSPVTGGQDSVSLAAVDFVNEPARDLHINPTSAAANAAADLSNVFTFDVDGGTRITTWDIGADDVAATTEVELLAFTATGADGAIELRWETGSELNNMGFHLYRAVSADGPYARITTHMIPGLGSSPAGATYSYRDPGLTNGTRYFYQLEDIETTGRVERHGPVAAVPGEGGGGVESAAPEHEEARRSASALITYGKPLANKYRILRRGRRHVVVELVTKGFYAEPQDDGTVVISVPGFEPVADDGTPALPVKRSWLEVPRGAEVELVSVKARGVETISSWPLAGAEVHELDASAAGTVRLVRARRRRVMSGEGLYPAEAARVLGLGFQQDVRKAHLELAPLRWDASTGELWLTRRLVVRLTLRHRKPHLSRVRRREPRVVARLATQRDGLYELRHEDLFRRGIGVPVRKLRLTRLGEVVPFHVEPPRRRFRDGSRLYFVSDGAAANPYGDEAVFELELGTGGAVMDVQSAPASGGAVPFFWSRVEREENRFYQAALVDAPDLWLWDVLIAPSTKRYPFALPGLAETSSPSRLLVDLQGASDTSAALDHHIRVYVNRRWVGETHWNGKAARHLELDVPAGVLKEGNNELALENVGDTEAVYSMVMLNRFSVLYPRVGVAEHARFDGRANLSGAAGVSGVGGGAFVLDVTESAPVWVEGSSVDGSVAFRAEAHRDYLIVGDQAVLRPAVRRARRPQLRDPRKGADYLLIAPRSFLGVAEPLVEHRRVQGLRVQAVAVEDIFAEFGFGEARPGAIRDFIAHVYHHWPAPALRYVVLLGDGTYDFKDHFGTGVPNRVPPLVTRTSYLWTASDPSMAAVHGDDRLPDVAIGRVPASDVDELRNYVEKILTYEELTPAPGTFVLVTDDPDGAGDFDADADDIASSVLGSRDLLRLDLTDFAPATLRSEIRRSFDDGASLVSYIGHGGIHLWADENLFNIRDVATLASQPHQPFVVTMNCLNGYFHFPFFDSLAERLLVARGRGAIAAFAPSGLSRNDAAHRFHRLVLDAVYNESHDRLGDAILAAQSAYAETGAFPELVSIYHLFGDPALRLR